MNVCRQPSKVLTDGKELNASIHKLEIDGTLLIGMTHAEFFELRALQNQVAGGDNQFSLCRRFQCRGTPSAVQLVDLSRVGQCAPPAIRALLLSIDHSSGGALRSIPKLQRSMEAWKVEAETTGQRYTGAILIQAHARRLFARQAFRTILRPIAAKVMTHKILQDCGTPVTAITVYVISVRRGNNCWSVEHRFSDWCQLDNTLGKLLGGYNRPMLPSRFDMFGGERLAESRTLTLDDYLQRMIVLAAEAPLMRFVLTRFLSASHFHWEYDWRLEVPTSLNLHHKRNLSSRVSHTTRDAPRKQQASTVDGIEPASLIHSPTTNLLIAREAKLSAWQHTRHRREPTTASSVASW